MLLPELVENVGGVEAGVVAKLPGDDLQGLGHGANDELLLAGDGAGVVAQILAQLHLDGAAAGDDGVVLDGATHDHDGVVEGALGLLHELLGAAAEDEGARLGLGHAGEEVEALSTDLKEKNYVKTMEMEPQPQMG